MKYIKIMLTIITILLVLLVVKDKWPKSANAQSKPYRTILENEVINVNIVSVDGIQCKGGKIKVMTQAHVNW